MRICFLDNNPIPYSSNDLYTNNIRGAESALINLASSLKKIGNDVCVFNNIQDNITINGIDWFNIKKLNNSFKFDIAFTNNDINLFDNINVDHKIALSHSVQTLEKFVRQKQLLAYLKHKPKIVFLGDYHEKSRSFLLKIFGSIKINWCAEKIFTEANLNSKIDLNKAIFTSYKDRNLKLLIDIWRDFIFPNNVNYKLFITPIDENLSKFNIFNRSFKSKDIMIEDMKSSRLYLIPGHKGEVFCLAAEEARELCIPIVTLGIGSLSERVDHNKTGFIANNQKQFAEYTVELFSNNEIWNKFRNNLIEKRGRNNWLEVSKNLINQIS